jgi:hypothetical protein
LRFFALKTFIYALTNAFSQEYSRIVTHFAFSPNIKFFDIVLLSLKKGSAVDGF